MTNDVWEASMSKAMTRHNTVLRWLNDRATRTEHDLENTRQNLGEIRSQIREEIEENDREMKKILAWRGDPVVYVRNYNGSTVRVYHGSLSCGWIGRRYKPMLLGEAQDAGLLPCVSCGYRAARQPAA